MIIYEPFDRWEFLDKNGRVRTVAGCSVVGLWEFQDRIAEIWNILEESCEKESWLTIYDWNERFKFLINRCLELNGVDPDWLNPSMLESMLFGREEDGKPLPGHLIEINEGAKTKAKGKPPTLAQTLAAIATQTEDIGKAMEVANTVPAKDLGAILDELAEIRLAQANPEAAASKKRKAKSREQIEKMRAKMGGGQPSPT